MLKIYYKSASGQVLNLLSGTYKMLSATDLLNHEWNYTNNEYVARIESFGMKFVPHTFKVSISAGTKDEYNTALKQITDTFEKDVKSKTAGRLYINDEYLPCYIIASEQERFDIFSHRMVKAFKLISEQGQWIKEKGFCYESEDGSAGEPYGTITAYKVTKTKENLLQPYYTTDDYREVHAVKSDLKLSAIYRITSKDVLCLSWDGATHIGLADGAGLEYIGRDATNEAEVIDFLTEITTSSEWEPVIDADIARKGYFDLLVKFSDDSQEHKDNTFFQEYYRYNGSREQKREYYFELDAEGNYKWAMNIDKNSTLYRLKPKKDTVYVYLNKEMVFTDGTEETTIPAGTKTTITGVKNKTCYIKPKESADSSFWDTFTGYATTFEEQNEFVPFKYKKEYRYGGGVDDKIYFAVLTVPLSGNQPESFIDYGLFNYGKGTPEDIKEKFTSILLEQARADGINIELVDTSLSDLDFVYDYNIDYNFAHIGKIVANTNVAPADFTMKIKGYAEMPEVTIGNHLYNVRTIVGYGETLVIDSREKKIYKELPSGQKKNCFAERNKDSYIFEKIPSGNYNMTKDGSYEMSLTLYEERSTPEWWT